MSTHFLRLSVVRGDCARMTAALSPSQRLSDAKYRTNSDPINHPKIKRSTRLLFFQIHFSQELELLPEDLDYLRVIKGLRYRFRNIEDSSTITADNKNETLGSLQHNFSIITF